MVLSARRMLKRVSVKPLKLGGRLAGLEESTAHANQPVGQSASPAMSLATEQISTRPREFVEQRRQANGE